MSKKIETLKLADVKFPAKLQPRAALNESALEDYKNRAKAAKEKGADIPFPPMKAIRRNGEIIAYSGFHRRPAIKHAGYEEAQFEVTENDAITDQELFILALRQNEEHGARYSSEDKLHNLLRVLEFPGVSEMSNVQIGEMAGVSENFVRAHKPASKETSVRTTKSGRRVDVSRIGKKGGKTPKKSTSKKAAAKKSGAAKKDKTGEGEKPQMSDECQRAVRRIANVLGGTDGETFKKAIESETLQPSAKELKDWAATSEARIKRIYVLVSQKGFTVTKSISFIDTVATATSKAEHFINRAISNNGVDHDEIVDGFQFVVFNKETHKLERNIQTGVITIIPKK